MWMKELQRVSVKKPLDGITLSTFAEQLGIGETTARRRMRLLINNKKWEMIGVTSIIGIDGQKYTNTPVYAPVKRAKNVKK